MIDSGVAEDDPVSSLSLSDLSSSSSVSDRVCVPWGCELNGSQRTVLFDVEDYLLENQFFIKTICLSSEAVDEMHVVGVCDGVGGAKAVPVAALHHSMPMISFPGFELIPPVTFKLCSGHGPVFIFGQHVTLVPEEIAREEEEEEL
ncbi:nucleoplasmin-2a [Chanos chanos]|uniref:Nucleoplasmin-2a n=1 Tax=Chanos chanos TaxID=29144 RepID=A0A6J2UQN3_CHACN|nr:nucleoplasmin-like [Chanos chanos]